MVAVSETTVRAYFELSKPNIQAFFILLWYNLKTMN